MSHTSRVGCVVSVPDGGIVWEFGGARPSHGPADDAMDAVLGSAAPLAALMAQCGVVAALPAVDGRLHLLSDSPELRQAFARTTYAVETGANEDTLNRLLHPHTLRVSGVCFVCFVRAGFFFLYLCSVFLSLSTFGFHRVVGCLLGIALSYVPITQR